MSVVICIVGGFLFTCFVLFVCLFLLYAFKCYVAFFIDLFLGYIF